MTYMLLRQRFVTTDHIVQLAVYKHNLKPRW